VEGPTTAPPQSDVPAPAKSDIRTPAPVPLPAPAKKTAANPASEHTQPAAANPTPAPKPLHVAADVQAANILKKVVPTYPPLAKQARIQGKVVFAAIIGRDGAIQSLQLISGHPLLAPGAMEAVKQWLYKPTMVNSQPVEVATQIEINFTLSDAAATQKPAEVPPTTAPQPQVYNIGNGVSAPVILRKVEPEYTEEARKAKYAGTVLLQVEVWPDGTVHNAKVLRSLGLGLDEKAVEAVKQWKFRPGYKDGRPVAVTVAIQIRFNLL
jgi:TonB family protein